MKFCQKCGKELMDEAVMCPACGCAVGDGQPKNQTSEVSEPKSKWDSKKKTNMAIGFAFLFPIVGLILGIIGLIKSEQKEVKKRYIGAIILSVVVWIVCIIVMML